MRRRLLTLACVVVLLAGSRATAQGTAEDNKSLDESLKAWITAFNKHDAKATAATYADDADLMDPKGERMKGREAIEKGLADFFSKNPNVTARLSDVSRRFLTADILVEDGTWEESGHSEVGRPTKGFYSSILMKRNGKWLVVHERAWVPTK